MTTYLDRRHDLGNPIQILAYIHHQNVFDILIIEAVVFYVFRILFIRYKTNKHKLRKKMNV